MSMTISQLKQELINHGITLPESSARKEVYEKLYQEYVVKPKALKAQRKPGKHRRDEFSSDEEFGNEMAHRENGNGLNGAKNHDDDEMLVDPILAQEIDSLSNEDIYNALIELGQDIGPVVDTTREMYKKRLIKVRQSNGHHANGNVEAEINFNGNGLDNGTVEMLLTVQQETAHARQEFSSDEEMDTSEPHVDSASSNTKPVAVEKLNQSSTLLKPGSLTASKWTPVPSTSTGKIKCKSMKKVLEDEEEVLIPADEANRRYYWTIAVTIAAIALTAYIVFELYEEYVSRGPKKD